MAACKFIGAEAFKEYCISAGAIAVANTLPSSFCSMCSGSFHETQLPICLWAGPSYLKDYISSFIRNLVPVEILVEVPSISSFVFSWCIHFLQGIILFLLLVICCGMTCQMYKKPFLLVIIQEVQIAFTSIELSPNASCFFFF